MFIDILAKTRTSLRSYIHSRAHIRATIIISLIIYVANKDVRMHPRLVLIVYPARHRSAVAPQLRTVLDPKFWVVLPSGQGLHGLLLAEDEYFPTSQIEHDPSLSTP